MELDTVLSDLESQGYSCQSFVIPACAVDARHKRDRVWIVAHADGNSEIMADADSNRLQGRSEEQVYGVRVISRKFKRSGQVRPSFWSVEPNVGRVADGVPNRSHRLKSLGNAVVPQVVAAIAQAIIMSQQDEQ